MAKLVTVTGMPKVISRLRLSKKMTINKIARNLKEAGLFIQRESEKVVPVDTGVLKASARTRNVGGSGAKTDVVVSYSTDYAVLVHENLRMRHKPGKVAKYLEIIVKTMRTSIFAIIGKG